MKGEDCVRVGEVGGRRLGCGNMSTGEEEEEGEEASLPACLLAKPHPLA